MRTLYKRDLPFERTGESWDITCRDDAMGIVENGVYAGKYFSDWIQTDPEGILGTRAVRSGDAGGAKRGRAYVGGSFPLLVKIIDARDDLSIQVHPGGGNGKNEMWYVMEAPAEGFLIIGLQDGVTREDLRKAYDNGTVENCLHRLTVRKGDIVDIPAGLVHALTKGVVVAEVQQNTDITYRLYDYNRMGLDGSPRELHLEKALDTVDFTGRLPRRVVPGLEMGDGENQWRNAVTNKFFTVDKYNIRKPFAMMSDPARFSIFTCVEGTCRIVTPAMNVEVPVSRSVFVPAGLGAYEWVGKGTLLKSSVP
jgi:mannose-6-phosphate isomerase